MGFIPWKKLIDRTEEDFEESFETTEEQLKDVLFTIFAYYDGKNRNVGDARLYALQKMMDGEIPPK